jgi:hypothetical protein
MDPKPFKPLKRPRRISRRDLPKDLAEFYRTNEGVGLNSSSDRVVRLCKLSEVFDHGWSEIPLFGEYTEPGWEGFRGMYIGASQFGDIIYRVRKAPCCSAGSILALGMDVAGPGGTGTHSLEASLVLAKSFDAWLAHLERYDWVEYGFVPGDIKNQPDADQAELQSYYRSLNPSIDWGSD